MWIPGAPKLMKGAGFASQAERVFAIMRSDVR